MSLFAHKSPLGGTLTRVKAEVGTSAALIPGPS